MNDRDHDFELFGDADANDLDVEFTDLDDDDEDDNFRQQLPIRSTKPRPRFTLRQRRAQVAVTVSTIVLLLCVLLGTYAPVRTRIVQTILSHPTASTPSGANSERFYFDANPTWVQLTVDGKKISHIPTISNVNDTPLLLLRGRHTFSWTAPPFLEDSCTLTIPFNTASDTCHFYPITRYARGASVWLFQFPFSLASLPHLLYTNLVTTVQEELDANDATETVLPGELYVVNTSSLSGTIERATMPLKATLRYSLDVENSLGGVCSTIFVTSAPCTYNGQECYLFCTVPVMDRDFTSRTSSWYVFATIQATWQYSALNGTVIEQNQPELYGTSVLYDHLLPLHITWDGSNWHVFSQTARDPLLFEQPMDVSCNTALNAIRDVLVPTNAAQARSGINWQYSSGANPALGCLSIGTVNPGSSTPSPPPISYCLYRFGVLLAANSIAHQYWPDLPLADSYEQEIAKELASQYDSFG